jgi:hypothetical protein
VIKISCYNRYPNIWQNPIRDHIKINFLIWVFITKIDHSESLKGLFRFCQWCLNWLIWSSSGQMTSNRLLSDVSGVMLCIITADLTLLSFSEVGDTRLENKVYMLQISICGWFYRSKDVTDGKHLRQIIVEQLIFLISSRKLLTAIPEHDL